ncbi:hypothetical protein [Actinophytocola sp. KF-1]
MGFFTSDETVVPVPSDDISVDPRVVAALPDPGDYLMDLLGDLSQESLDLVAGEIARVRHPNGAIPFDALTGVGVADWKSGPLTLLVSIHAGELIATSVWASFGLPRRQRKAFESTVEEIVRGQGVPAAATWALMSRPDAKPHLDFLAESLLSSYGEARLTNGDVIKAFRKWRR